MKSSSATVPPIVCGLDPRSEVKPLYLVDFGDTLNLRHGVALTSIGKFYYYPTKTQNVGRSSSNLSYLEVSPPKVGIKNEP